MMKSHGAGCSGDDFGLWGEGFGHFLAHRATKETIGGVVVNRSSVGPRCKQHGPVVFGHVINHDAHSQYVIVGVWIKRPVLVPRHWCTATLRFEIEFTVLEPNIRTKERAKDVGDLGISN